jgi:hypothetical protein
MGLRPAVGLGVAGGDGAFRAWSASIDVPVSIAVPVGAEARLVPFITPGLALGRLSGPDDAQSGSRAALGAGVGFRHSRAVSVHLAWRKVFIENGPSSVGVGLVINGRGR